MSASDLLRGMFAAMMIFIVAGWGIDSFLDTDAPRNAGPFGEPLWFAALMRVLCLLYIAAMIWRGRRA